MSEENKLDILIQLIADVTGAKLTQEQIDQVKAKAADLNKGLKESAGSATSLVGALESAAVVLPILTGIGLEVRNAVKSYTEWQQSVVGVDNALRNQGALTEENRKHYRDLADQLSETTAIAGDHWLDVLSRLTRFGASPDNIDKYAEAVKNLAGLMGADIDTAAHLFSRALQGNTEFLHRYGITVEKTGDQTRDLDRLMQLLAERGGGALEARAKTLAGANAALGDEFHRLNARIGDLVVQTSGLTAGKQLLAVALRKVGDLLPDVESGVSRLGNSVRTLSGDTTAAGQATDKLAEAFKKVQEASQKAFEGAGQKIAAQIDFEKQLTEQLMKRAEAEAEARGIREGKSPEEIDEEKLRIRGIATQQNNQADIQAQYAILNLQHEREISAGRQAEKAFQQVQLYKQNRAALDEGMLSSTPENVAAVEEQRKAAEAAQARIDVLQPIIEDAKTKQIEAQRRITVLRATDDAQAAERAAKDADDRAKSAKTTAEKRANDELASQEAIIATESKGAKARIDAVAEKLRIESEGKGPGETALLVARATTEINRFLSKSERADDAAVRARFEAQAKDAEAHNDPDRASTYRAMAAQERTEQATPPQITPSDLQAAMRSHGDVASALRQMIDHQKAKDAEMVHTMTAFSTDLQNTKRHLSNLRDVHAAGRNR